eukprot:scaffold74597_cov69-Phaeocystis_antarctica.AAC.1
MRRETPATRWTTTSSGPTRAPRTCRPESSATTVDRQRRSAACLRRKPTAVAPERPSALERPVSPCALTR